MEIEWEKNRNSETGMLKQESGKGQMFMRFFYHETREKKFGIGGTSHRIVSVVVCNRSMYLLTGFEKREKFGNINGK